jgi:hypothetical protein
MTRRGSRRESTLEAWCVKWARARGVQVSKNTELAGIPDRTFWVPGGRPLVPEFKRPDGKSEPSPAQVWHMKKLHKMGYDSPLVESRDGFIRLMAEKGVR